jgi:hypothetical protein
MNGAGSDSRASRTDLWHLFIHLLVGAIALALLGFTAMSVTATANSPDSSGDVGVGGTGLEVLQTAPAADKIDTPAYGKWDRLDLRCNECNKGRLVRQDAPFVITPAFYETTSGTL